MKSRKVIFFFLVVLIGLVIAEFIIGKFKPQITFSQAVRYSIDCHESDPVLPFSLRKNFNCKMVNYFGDFNTQASINSLGYRGKEFQMEKKEGTKRILVLGDSMTFGIGVSDGETYPEKFEEVLKENKVNNIEVINAGYADSFSPDSYLVYLKNRGLKLKPDAIILGFFVWNDMTDLSETVWEGKDEKDLPEKVISCCRVVDQGQLRGKEIEFKYKYPILRESQLYLSLIEVVKNKFGFFQPPKSMVAKRDQYQGCILNPSCIDNFRQEEEKTFKVMEEIKKLIDQNDIFLLTVLFPVDYQLYPEMGFKYGSTLYPPDDNKNFIQKRIGEKLSGLGISFLDLYPVYDRQRNRGNPFFTYDAHLNSLGHQIAGEEIAKYLLEHLKFDR